MRYFILNVDKDPKKAELGPSIFYDASSGLKILSKDPKNPVEFDGPLTKKIQSAIKNGHIKEVEAPKGAKGTKGAKAPEKIEEKKVEEPESEEEDEETETETETEKEFKDMSDEELLAYYKKEYDVTKKDEEKFNKMTRDGKIAFLTEE